jgi:2-amino-4-hydroxy-6-hydroxymethyldihydropteridine diphosphokinase
LLAFGTQIFPSLEEYAKWHNLPMSDQLKQAPIEMILPHPRIQNRAFVLKPLMDINPHWEHPVSGLTVTEMYANLSEGDREGISTVAEQ